MDLFPPSLLSFSRSTGVGIITRAGSVRGLKSNRGRREFIEINFVDVKSSDHR